MVGGLDKHHYVFFSLLTIYARILAVASIDKPTFFQDADRGGVVLCYMGMEWTFWDLCQEQL
ncbi:hypothetical protein Pla144_08070 [Bythopirellula polymerisocia]|uniref:Uncharacterized protein n=1 Tax=Bythopirellula polymerisocia TaxID=2528003 RepID=A0A5C6D2L2_9BACT|nr:hypothetical protein Pla144_08070 [Bythopirellula polymerisocia]